MRLKLHQSTTSRAGQELSLFSHNPILVDSELQFWHGDKAVQSRARVYLLVERNLSNERIAQTILSSRVTAHRGAVGAQWSVQVKKIVTDARASMFKYVESRMAWHKHVTLAPSRGRDRFESMSTTLGPACLNMLRSESHKHVKTGQSSEPSRKSSVRKDAERYTTATFFTALRVFSIA